jgi:uncharacterized radical SAM protein YgiQ
VTLQQPAFVPMTREAARGLGWDEFDAVIVTGDAYVDHPAFGAAVIARVLIDAGFRTGIISQPRWTGREDFLALGRPRLFFGVTAGNVDSLVANLSPTRQRRRDDDYSPGGRAGLRPDRATLVYCNRLRELFPGVPLVLGGIEASLRRLAHYDYWDDSVRRSLLVDARADLLVYGMGERQVVAAAQRLARGEDVAGIAGTCVVARERPEGAVLLPAYEQVRGDKRAFAEAFKLWYRSASDPGGPVVAQAHAERFVVQYPMSPPQETAELDRVYELPYARAADPSYTGPVPALEPVRFSIVAHRGCLGNCAFCSLAAHQGRVIQARSMESVVREARRMTRQAGFKGHITDVGGPSANMYGATCRQMQRGRACAGRDCTFPRRCPELRLGLEREIELLDAVRRVPGVKRVTVGSGVRFDLLDDAAGRDYIEQLCRWHVSGQLRVAPEHVAQEVLAQMRKGTHDGYLRFREEFAATNRRLKRKQYLIPYFISGHPGATVDDAVLLAEYLVRVERFRIRQVQQFTPLPMTLAGAAWHTGIDPLTGRPVHVARDEREQRLQRALLQLHTAENFRLAERELSRLGRRDLIERIRRLRPLLHGVKTEDSIAPRGARPTPALRMNRRRKPA